MVDIPVKDSDARSPQAVVASRDAQGRTEPTARSGPARAAILVPLVYLALLSFSASSAMFRVDDPQEFQFVADAGSLSALLKADVFGLFRPVKNLLFLAYSKLAPFGLSWCHLVSVLIGCISFYPVLALCRRILGSEDKALLAATIWLFAPTLVSSAAWLSCTNILVMAAFSAWAIALHDSAWDGGRFRASRIPLAVLSMLVALFSYECAIAAVPIIVLFDFCLRPGRVRTKRAIEAYALYAIAAALYLVLRGSIGATTAATGYIVGTTRLQTILSSPHFFVDHFLLWLWPFGRLFVLGSYQWGDVPAWRLAICWILLLSAGGWCLWNRHRHSVLAFCLLFFLVGFAPTSNCLGLGNGPFCDCYVALASIGLAAGFSKIVFFLLAGSCRKKVALSAFAILLLATRAAATIETAFWARAWSSGESVLSQSVRNRPEFFSNKLVLASELAANGNYREALRLCGEIEGTIDRDLPHFANVHAIRGLYELNETKDAERALQMFDECHRIDATVFADGNWHYYRGRVFEDLEGNLDEAEREYALASSGEHANLAATARLGRLLGMRGDYAGAIALLETVVRAQPNNETALWNLGIAYRKAGDEARSKKSLSRANRFSKLPKE